MELSKVLAATVIRPPDLYVAQVSRIWEEGPPGYGAWFCQATVVGGPDANFHFQAITLLISPDIAGGLKSKLEAEQLMPLSVGFVRTRIKLNSAVMESMPQAIAALLHGGPALVKLSGEEAYRLGFFEGLLPDGQLVFRWLTDDHPRGSTHLTNIKTLQPGPGRQTVLEFYLAGPDAESLDIRAHPE
ncbi:MAG: hypothetical protein V1826_02055 [bacterium]